MGKKWEKNLKIAFNFFYAINEKICPTYVSKHNSNVEKRVIFVMIPNGEGSHYIAVKSFIKVNIVKLLWWFVLSAFV